MATTETSHPLTGEMFEQANQRAQERLQGPRAVGAIYDPQRQRIVISLTTNLEVSFPTQETEGLSAATPEQLSNIELSPSGLGLHFPQLDVDLYLPSLLVGMFGSKAWAAARLGARGGATKSEAKALASRENGKRGGRPRKKAAAVADEAVQK